MAIFTFSLFLLLFLAVGLFSLRAAQRGTKDYLLAGRGVPALLTALSAASTKNSGYMFIGLMGYIYVNGLSAIWLICGFLFGDLIAFSFVHKRVHQASEQTDAVSFAELISRWHGGDYRHLRLAVGLITLIFLLIYAAAQLNAGGKALQVIFGWHYQLGAFIGAGLILVYCWAGGLRASIWTDAGQSVLMLAGMLILLSIAIAGQGGVSEFITALEGVAPGYFDWGQQRFGGADKVALFAFGWLFNGVGVVGQPQVMVRFMALSQQHTTRTTGIYYFLWSVLFLITTLFVGLSTRLYLGGDGVFDAELALPKLAQALLPGIGVGIIIGSIFAASMSTIDSQLLSCATVLSVDFKIGHSRNRQRLILLVTTLAALVIALYATANVFTLVVFAWSALACGIGPLVIVHALKVRPTQGTALAMMVVGIMTAMLWRYYKLDAYTYEGFPGIMAALLTCLLLTMLQGKKKTVIVRKCKVL